MMLRRIYLYLFSLLLIGACAKPGNPSGGRRDIIPPVVVDSKPVNGAINFHENEIEIEFNEFVQLDNISEKLMVSPPLKKKPNVNIRGKSIIIKYEDQLRDSTTYSFYFQDAIRDLNESNILNDYKFVFSTGPVIDSLTVTGNVYNAGDLEIPEKASVMLYSDLSDSAVVKKLPDYISGIGSDGFFRIDNIRNGSYRLFALTDDDNSKNYNRIEEPFGFLDSVITVTSEKNYIPETQDTLKTVTSVTDPKSQTPQTQKPSEQLPVNQRIGEYQLHLFTAKPKSRYLKNSSRESKYKLTYALSIPPDTMDFNVSVVDASAVSYILNESVKKDSITVWITDSTLYSKDLINTIVRYPFTDSSGADTYRQDTIAMRFITPKTRAPRTKPKLILRNNVPGGSIKPGQKVVFTSEAPLREPDTTLIDLFKLKDKEKNKIPFALLTDTFKTGKLILDAKLEEGSQYQLITDSASITNIYDEAIDSASILFSVKETGKYSSLILNITNCRSACIIQLLNNLDKLVDEKIITSDGTVEFRLLDKGNYKIRSIYDLNNDGQWTTGDYFTRRQPEPVSYFPKELVLPESWQVKESWDLAVKNTKDQKLRKAKNTAR